MTATSTPEKRSYHSWPGVKAAGGIGAAGCAAHEHNHRPLTWVPAAAVRTAFGPEYSLMSVSLVKSSPISRVQLAAGSAGTDRPSSYRRRRGT